MALQGNARREHLLDHFPLNQRELDLLLPLQQQEYVFEVSLLQRMFDQAQQTVFSSCTDEAAQFLEALVSVCGRRDERILWRLLETEQGSCVQAFIDLFCEASSGAREACPKLVTTSTSLDPQKTPKEEAEWIKTALPRFPFVVATVFSRAVGLKLPASLSGPEGIDFPLWHSPSCVPLQLSLMDLGGRWQPIYRSDDDGLSFHTFSSALIGFTGPTVTLIQTAAKDLVGYYTEVPWRTSTKWFTGDGSSILFRLQPEWSIYLPQFHGTNIPKKFHQYLHLPHTSPVKREIEGLAVGGITSNLPRLHLPLSLERCKACEVGSVFESGPLLSDSQLFFDVQAIEVWSVREEKYAAGKLAGQQQIEVQESFRQRIARVEPAEFIDHLTQNSSLFSHRQSDRPNGNAGALPHDRGGEPC